MLGLATVPSVINFPSNNKTLTDLNELASDPLTHIYPFKPPGKGGNPKFHTLRKQYFVSGKLVSLNQVPKRDPTTNALHIYVVLTFNCVESKTEYLRDRSEILSSGQLS